MSLDPRYKRIYISLIVIFAALAVVFLLDSSAAEQAIQINNKVQNIVKNDNYTPGQPKDDVVTPERVLLGVPFIIQAPTAKWSDPRQQDGCEEASILMAHLWITGKTMTAAQAEAEIIALSEWQKEKYGEFVDRSVSDTAVMMTEYYGHDKVTIKKNITKQDIIDELAQDRMVIVPTSGQILANPNYSGTGPITHMLPIIGYDQSNQEFITHDPGTRRGSEWRYSYDRLIDSIYDYQTGNHEGYHKTETIMMVVEK